MPLIAPERIFVDIPDDLQKNTPAQVQYLHKVLAEQKCNDANIRTGYIDIDAKQNAFRVVLLRWVDAPTTNDLTGNSGFSVQNSPLDLSVTEMD